MTTERNRLCIAILALGGQGGGVLADWIQDVARSEGWLAQGTSVPGVAQRTGSTVYYVELVRQEGDRRPIMAQMPAPGDVDVVIASELMEVGRAMVRGFASPDRTTLIGSTHRIFAISEKSAMGDGRGDGDKIIEAAGKRGKRFIGFDMEAATERSGSVISSIMFGAVAGSGALPFKRESYEEAIRHSKIAVESNLKGFNEGFRAAQAPVAKPIEIDHHTPQPTTEAGRALAARIAANLPVEAHRNALHGLHRLMDYQDARYAGLYLDRLEAIARLNAPAELSVESARHLALWMSYEDTIRVADLKTRASRVDRVRIEVQAKDSQLMGVTEFMHPRLQEVCETLPVPLGRAILNSKGLCKLLEPMFRKGRYVKTTSLRWFVVLRTLAGMRGMRPASLRYHEEQERIEGWLERVAKAAGTNPALALEIVLCQRLIKGYGDTFERGVRNYTRILAAIDRPDVVPDQVRTLRDLALTDEEGKALTAALADLSSQMTLPTAANA